MPGHDDFWGNERPIFVGLDRTDGHDQRVSRQRGHGKHTTRPTDAGLATTRSTELKHSSTSRFPSSMPTRPTPPSVIGMGPGGEDVAGRLAEAGLAVVGFERQLLDGECQSWGCVSSLLATLAANLLAEASRVPGMAATPPGGRGALRAHGGLFVQGARATSCGRSVAGSLVPRSSVPRECGSPVEPRELVGVADRVHPGDAAALHGKAHRGVSLTSNVDPDGW
jgi:hypothetical protein